MLVAQDQDSNEVLNGKGIQLAYCHLETLQHSDDDFGNREPQATTHYERFVASEITPRGVISAFPSTRNPELHRAWNVVERPQDLEELVSTPAWCSFLNCTMGQERERLLFGRSDRTIMRNPPRLILGGIYRVRHELYLWNEELFMSTCGRRPFPRNLFLTRYFTLLFGKWKEGIERKKESFLKENL